MTTSAKAAPERPGPALLVPAGPWSVRAAGGRRGRAALEVYEHGELLDVVVLSRLSPALLCGARRSVTAGRAVGLAWGRLPADGRPPLVEFTGGRLRPLRCPARVVTVSGAFWTARAEGRFSGVEAVRGGSAERLRLGRARPVAGSW
ncbi:hypothetical protein [Kitasatospora sp. NPDC057223]|uniref:hypothetical protein n=1 Tax=Kitasatospora sp. NPDC057223 TaxID=3346055 RepID=UPI003624B6B3